MRLSPLAPVLALALGLLAMPALAVAEAPARVPIQGFLTDANGTPIDGATQIQVRLYDVATGGTAWFDETQVVAVEHGELTVNLGTIQTLDLRAFRRDATYVGIAIAGDAEMSPRLQIGSVPYAAFAQETAAVPPGAVMMFDLDACPPGWSALDAARGRTLVGVPTNGTRGGTVGPALADVEDRSHGHGVDPAPVTSSSGGAHTHTVDPASAMTTASGPHSHWVNTPNTTTEPGGSHNHAWASWNAVNKIWSTFNSAGVSRQLVDWDDGMDTAGSGDFPLQADVGTESFHTNMGGSHTHTLYGSGFYSADGGNHTHAVDVVSTTSSSAGSHNHTCDIPATPTTAATTGQVMPYLQLLVCRKD